MKCNFQDGLKNAKKRHTVDYLVRVSTLGGEKFGWGVGNH